MECTRKKGWTSSVLCCEKLPPKSSKTCGFGVCAAGHRGSKPGIYNLADASSAWVNICRAARRVAASRVRGVSQPGPIWEMRAFAKNTGFFAKWKKQRGIGPKNFRQQRSRRYTQIQRGRSLTLHEREREMERNRRTCVGRSVGNTHSRRVFYSGSQHHVNYSANTPEFRENAPEA